MKNRNLDNHNNWATPLYIYDPLNKEFHFDFDPCPLNNDISKFDGLSIDWGQSNFVNPPYSRDLKEAFIIKSIEEYKKGKIVVMLLPVSTSTNIFHDYIKPNASEIRFVRGRIKFIGFNTFGQKVENKCGMHDSMIVVFNNLKK